MTKKGIMLGILSLAIAGTAAYAASAAAYRGNPGETGPNYTPERHESMQKAFESNDYNAWKNLMPGRGRVSEVINEGNFNRFAEAYRMAKEGKTAEANQIRQELGLGQGNGNGQRGQNRGGNFIDADKDGVCDRMR